MKIAVLGSAPSSVKLAPYSDPTWSIWGCSPRGAELIPRSEAWFEIHPWKPGTVHGLHYITFLASHPGPVWMIEERREIPNSRAYPKKEMLAEFGEYFFVSSISWMMAMAIVELEKSGDDEKVLGLWGVDMQAKSEYEHQRPACHFFIREADRRGIKIAAPPESDILCPPPLYGFDDTAPRQVKIAAKHAELKQKIRAEKSAIQAAEVRAAYFQGAIEMTEYFQRTKL